MTIDWKSKLAAMHRRAQRAEAERDRMAAHVPPVSRSVSAWLERAKFRELSAAWAEINKQREANLWPELLREANDDRDRLRARVVKLSSDQIVVLVRQLLAGLTEQRVAAEFELRERVAVLIGGGL